MQQPQKKKFLLNFPQIFQQWHLSSASSRYGVRVESGAAKKKKAIPAHWSKKATAPTLQQVGAYRTVLVRKNENKYRIIEEVLDRVEEGQHIIPSLHGVEAGQ